MADLEPRQERRARDRSQGIQLRRRNREPVEVDQRRNRSNGFDIASALEMYLDEIKTRRAMLELLESWLNETNNVDQAEHNGDYRQAVEHAIDVVKTAPDVLTAVAILQRAH